MNKIITFIFFVFILVGIVNSCSKKEENSNSLTMIILDNGGQDQKIPEYFDSVFKKEHPSATLKLIKVPFQSLDSKIITASNAGESYDLVFTNHTAVGLFADAGVLSPLDDYITNDKIRFDNMNKSFLNSTKYKGKQWAMPYETDTRILAVNKRLFEQEGLNYPETKEDMLDVIKKMTKDTDGDGKLDQFGLIFDSGNMWFPTYDLGAWLLGEGSRLYAPNGDSYIPEINSEGGKRFLEWAKEIGKYQPVDRGYDGTKIITAFKDNRVGLFIFGPWSIDNFEKLKLKYKEDYDLITNPIGSVKSGATMGGWHIGIGANSKNKDLAWEFLKSTLSPEHSAKIVNALPPNIKAYDFYPFNTDLYKVFGEQMKTAEIPNYPTPQLSKIAEEWHTNFEKVTLGQLEVTIALQKTSDFITNEFKK